MRCYRIRSRGVVRQGIQLPLFPVPKITWRGVCDASVCARRNAKIYQRRGVIERVQAVHRARWYPGVLFQLRVAAHELFAR